MGQVCHTEALAGLNLTAEFCASSKFDHQRLADRFGRESELLENIEWTGSLFLGEYCLITLAVGHISRSYVVFRVHKLKILTSQTSYESDMGALH